MSATRPRRPRVGDLRDRLPRGVRRSAPQLRVSLRRPSPILAGALIALVLMLGALWLWLRDSSLVSIQRVRITGVSGPNMRQIDRALRNAALGMSTMNVNMAQLRTAVQPYPDVRTLQVDTQFPHGIVIHVTEQVPTAEVTVAGRLVPVSGDGTLLAPSVPHGSLPTIGLRVPPGGTRITESDARAALAVLTAAPFRLLGHVARVTGSAGSGLVVWLRRGPQLRFGDTSQLHAKWAAALAVLGSAGSRGAQYIDVSDPRRPAAGATTTSTSASTSSTTSASTTTSPATTPTSATTAAATPAATTANPATVPASTASPTG